MVAGVCWVTSTIIAGGLTFRVSVSDSALPRRLVTVRLVVKMPTVSVAAAVGRTINVVVAPGFVCPAAFMLGDSTISCHAPVPLGILSNNGALNPGVRSRIIAFSVFSYNARPSRVESLVMRISLL